MLPRRLIILLSCCLLTYVTGCRHEAGAIDAPDGDTLVRVTPIKPTRESLVRFTEQPGQIAAIEEAPIYAKVSGYVRKVHVDIGDKVTGPVYDDGKLVTAGQTLLEIDVPELEKELAQRNAAIEQAKSETKQAEAAIKVAQASKASAAATVEETKAMVERANAERDRWQSELDRITDLAARQAVTNKLVDETQSKFRAADAAGREIAAKILSAEAHVTEGDALIEKAQADAEAAAAKQDVAVADRDRTASLLSYTTLTAPFSGVVAARHVDTGHLVNANSQAKEALLVIVRPEIVRVYVDVPEVDAVFIEPGAEAQLRVPSLAAEEVKGTVTRTTWVLDQATRTLRTEIDVPNPDSRLRPGMYAYAKLKVAERQDAWVIPKTAILTSGGQSFVWRVEADGTLIKQAIQTGLEAGGKVEVLAGLTGEQALLGVNPAAFREGQKVEVVAAAK